MGLGAEPLLVRAAFHTTSVPSCGADLPQCLHISGFYGSHDTLFTPPEIPPPPFYNHPCHIICEL